MQRNHLQLILVYYLMEYNTSRNKLLMPEYGRNIQRMVDYIATIDDPEKRQKNAQSIIELMGVLNPHLKNVEDFRHKLWDHLYQISDFKIEIDSPYPVPTREKLNQKPAPLPYPSKNKRNKHLGKNITQILDRGVAAQEEDKRRGFAQTVAYYMKLSYANWHKEQMQDDMIREELRILSGGALDYATGEIKVRFNNNSNNFKKHGGNNSSGGRNKNHSNGHSSKNNNRGGNNNHYNKNQKSNNNRSSGNII